MVDAFVKTNECTIRRVNCKVSYGLWVITTSVQVKNVPSVNDVDNEEATVSGSGGI